MSSSNLSPYLNDHLAGAAVAIRLFERLGRILEPGEMGRELRRLGAEVEEDRETLRGVVRSLGLREHRLRQHLAALAQQAGNLALRRRLGRGLRRGPGSERRGRGRGEVPILLALESLISGVRAKQALWRALAAAAEEDPRLLVAGYDELARRAERQLDSLRRLHERQARCTLLAPEAD